jgi:CRISPR/Cas system CSM-associated protein Csm3 (group 7 of RAMP superfamily)
LTEQAATALVPAGLDGTPWASYLWVEDCPEDDSKPVPTEVRDGVGINARTGAAAAGVLFNREVVPPGTRFKCEIRVEAISSGADRDPSTVAGLDKEKAKALLTEIISLLASGISLGHSTTTGLGRVRLLSTEGDGFEVRWVGLDNFADVEQVIGSLGLGQCVSDQFKAHESAVLPGHLRIEVPWQAKSPLLVSINFNGLVDRLPQTTGRDKHVRLVIPGSSLKGALRSRSSKIVRTLIGASTPSDNHIDQMSQDLGPVTWLFGSPPGIEKQGQRPVGARDQQEGSRRNAARGALTVGELYSEPLEDWQGLLEVLAQHPPNDEQGKKKRQQERARAGTLIRETGSYLHINDHVAIDRWTGGAAPGRLFATLAVEPSLPSTPTQPWGASSTIVLDVNLERVAQVAGGHYDRRDAQQATIMLLVLLLRDLAEGWIGIGHGTSRGYGEIMASPEEITLTWNPAAGTPQEERPGSQRTLKEVLDCEEAMALLTTSWQTVLAGLREARS